MDSSEARDLITPEQCGTLYGLFCERVRRSPQVCAYRDYDRNTKEWVDHSWADVAAQVARWQQAFMKERLAPGDRVAVCLRNSVEWIIIDQAALGMRLVVVPLYMDDRPDNAAAILEETGTRLLVAQDPIHWRRLAPALEAFGDLAVVVLGEPDATLPDPRVRWATTWLPEEGAALAECRSESGELATVVYTSGTGGKSKGVMLSHHNILSVAHAGLQVVSIGPGDVFLSFLPLSHMLERTAGHYLPMMAGATVAHARSVGQLADDLAAIRPTHLIAVPRIFERLHGRIRQQLEKAPPLKRRLFELAVTIGWQRFEYEQGRAPWSLRFLVWPLLQRVVARPLLNRLGGRLQLVVSGGAALGDSIAQMFIGLGLPILQGYGLTETSPQASVNRPDDNDPVSVGAPLPGTEVRVAENGELLIRGPGVMLGYWHDAEATARVIRDGWLHTGDKARIEGGRIYITGRLKDILVLSNGEKVPPSQMELAIASDPLFEQVLVFGEGRPFLGALVVLSQEQWPALAQSLGLPADADHLTNRQVVQAVQHRIAELLHRFPAYAKVRRVLLMLEPWSIENGLLTPTMKIKRTQVLERYRAQVDAVYELESP